MTSNSNYPDKYPRLPPQHLHQHQAGFSGQSLYYYPGYYSQHLMPFHIGVVPYPPSPMHLPQGHTHQGIYRGYHNGYNPYAPPSPPVAYPPIPHAHGPSYMIDPSVRYHSVYNSQSSALHSTPVTQKMPSTSNITPEQLLSLSPEDRKQILGEAIYPRVSAEQPDRAEKITGMFLQMDNNELLRLLEDPDAMSTKIREAMAVLTQQSKI